MKKKSNLILFGVLSLLLVFTYFIQEKKVLFSYKKEKSLIDMLGSELVSIKGPNFEAIKIKDSWFQNQQLLSHNIFKILEKRMREIKLIQELENAKDENFPGFLELVLNNKKVLIGDMSIDNESFYLKVENSFFLAKIDGESTQISYSQENLQKDKLVELKSLFFKKTKDIFEDQFFRYSKSIPLWKVAVFSEGRNPYVLDFKDNKTIPDQISGVEVHQNIKDKFFSLITQIQIKNELDYNKLKLFKKLASINFKDKNSNQDIIWEVWRKNQSTADPVIVDHYNQKAFEAIGGTLKVFFLDVQDYWDKKIIPTKDFKNFDKLKIEFHQNKLKKSVIISNREPFEFESSDGIPNLNNLQAFIQLVMNLSAFDQADRVSPLSSTDEKIYSDEKFLRFNIFDHKLLCHQKSHEIIMVNLTTRTKLHFYQNIESVFCDLKAMIE